MKLKALFAGAASALLLTFGVAISANAAPNAYVFGDTYRPHDFGMTQSLILNGGEQILQAQYTGSYYWWGYHDATSPGYIAASGTVFGTPFYANNYFVFDLSSVRTPITSAQLSLGNPGVVPGFPGGYGGDASATYTNYDVSTPISDLISFQWSATDTYTDLGTGLVYGSTTVSAADNGTQVLINLNSNALASLNAAEGGEWAIGGSLGDVPEPATWAMLVLGVAMIGIAARRSREDVSMAA